MPKLRHNNFGLLSPPSHLLDLQSAGQIHPSWLTTSVDMAHAHPVQDVIFKLVTCQALGHAGTVQDRRKDFQHYEP